GRVITDHAQLRRVQRRPAQQSGHRSHTHQIDPQAYEERCKFGGPGVGQKEIREPFFPGGPHQFASSRLFCPLNRFVVSKVKRSRGRLDDGCEASIGPERSEKRQTIGDVLPEKSDSKRAHHVCLWSSPSCFLRPALVSGFFALITMTQSSY